jgi:hypothetical protein
MSTKSYYDKNPEAYRKKLAYDAKYQKKNKKRVNKNKAECTKFRRDNGTYGNGSSMDCSHRNGSLIMERRSSNRARGGGQKK